ncbi:uncharacterized protein [Diadema antillarum]|uniref:uncharacterized protein n=1 Tax=Diadema antillarum TaxID=105358 RepID=UPI003A882059
MTPDPPHGLHEPERRDPLEVSYPHTADVRQSGRGLLVSDQHRRGGGLHRARGGGHSEGQPLPGRLHLHPVAFLVLLYLVYLVECWYSDVRIEIQYKEDVSTVYSRIRRIRNAYPVVWWRAISYHYNRHTRQVTRLETREGLGLTEVEFTDEMVTYACSEKLPWYVSMSMFWVTSLSMLSWPFRILISMNTAIVDYQIEKLFGTNYTANMITVEPWAGESGTITRVTAVDSNRSLETLIRDNRHVVPSYSEALLMEVANGNRSRSGLTPTGPGPPNAAHRGKHEHIVHSHDTNTRHNYLHGNGRSRTLRRSATTAVGLCYVSSLSNDRAAQSSTSDWTLRSPLTPNNRSLSNGHTPSTSLRILPSRSTSSHVLAISNMLSRIKPSTNSHNNASAATSDSVNRTAAIPTGDSEHNPSLRKPMMSASSTPSNRRHRRPTSLPLCFGSQGSQQDESEVVDEMQIESWVLMDGEGEVRTVTWHRANDFNQSTGGEGVVVVPMDSPPPYDAALNMHVPEEGGEGDTTEEQSSDNVETSV